MNYQQTLDYLFAKLPMFTRIGAAAYKANLNNITGICQLLGNPQKKFKSIHIAGTNGKGSTSHMLASVLQTAGYKTGLFTSPHLKDFRERIKINGKEVDEQWVIDFVEKIQPIIEIEQPSFFEITTAMAFAFFAEKQVDIAIIEVGMGGLLDSTNIIDPILSIITNISKDHTQFLGTSLQEIAVNKAGIIKPKIPVVIGQTQAETEKVFIEKANENDTPIYFADKIFDVIISQSNSIDLQCFKTINLSTKIIETLYVDVLGKYQKYNIKTVMMSVEILQNLGFNISNQQLIDALQNVKKNTGLIGRFDIVQQHPTVIYDVAHNVDGIEQLVNQLNEMKFKKLHFVLGFVADKDVETVLQLFPKNANFYFTKAQIPRALNETELQHLAHKHQLQGIAFANIKDAYKSAITIAGIDDAIIVCGSFFTLAELL